MSLTAESDNTHIPIQWWPRPVELAAAHERKKALKKALTEDADADALRGSPCSAHLSG